MNLYNTSAQSQIIDKQQWEFNITFNNHKQDPYKLPRNIIQQLVIEDDLLTWALRGYIVVDNRMEGFERDPLENKGRFIRSDARDELEIEIFPVIDAMESQLPDSLFKLKFTAVIYDVEDMPSENMTNKSKKLYFWDSKFQGIVEKNIQWSTATGTRFYTQKCPEPIAHQSDEFRSMYTGDIIASLLAAAGYESYIDFTQWDWGAGKLNFTAKADWNVWDCIMYIMKHHVSSDESKNDICILTWNRMTSKWNLLPMNRFFRDAGNSVNNPGPLQIEHLFFEMRGGTPCLSPWKAPFLATESFEKDIKSINYGTIFEYGFSQTSGLDNAKAYRSKPVHSHWHKRKQFNVEVEDNEITNVRDNFIKPNYISQLLSKTATPLMTLNETKTTARSVEPQFSPVSMYNPVEDKKIRTMDGRGKILYANIFLNHCMSIRLIGNTLRQTGTFIGIDRPSEPSDNDYDHQVCGQYFVVNVKHVFQHQKYINDIVMVKIHAYDKLPTEEKIP